MKILHIITTINRGGAENHLVELVTGQRKNQHDIVVIYLKGNGYWAEHMKNLGVKLYTLDIERYGGFFALWKVAQWIKYEKIDIIHAHMPPAELYARIGLLIIRNKKIPFIITKHNDEPFYRGLGHGFLGYWVAKRSQAIIAISNAVKNYVCSPPLNLPKKKVKRIYYGINKSLFYGKKTNHYFDMRQNWNLNENCLIIGTVARFVPQKGLHILLQAFAELVAKTQSNDQMLLRLVIVGQGPLETQLKLQAKQLNLEKNIIWAGFQENIPEIMGALDCFVLTSIYEGLGLVLLEAMASGLPIVASRVSAIPEIVKNAGILVAPEDAKAVAKALEQIINTPKLRQDFGKIGIERVDKYFNLEKMNLKTELVYHSCLKKS